MTISGSKPALRLIQTEAQLTAQRHAAQNTPAQVLGLSWYRHYPAETLNVARGWAMGTVGIFLLVRDLQWERGALPAAPEEVRRLTSVGISQREWKTAWGQFSAFFPLDVDGKRRNPQLAQQRFEAIGKRWQTIDAVNSRHHRHDGEFVPAAEAYLKAHADVPTDVTASVGTDELTHQHKRQHQPRNAYQEALSVLRSRNQSGAQEGDGMPGGVS